MWHRHHYGDPLTTGTGEDAPTQRFTIRPANRAGRPSGLSREQRTTPIAEWAQTEQLRSEWQRDQRKPPAE